MRAKVIASAVMSTLLLGCVATGNYVGRYSGGCGLRLKPENGPAMIAAKTAVRIPLAVLTFSFTEFCYACHREMERCIGMSEADLVIKFGAPSLRMVDSTNGDIVLSFIKSKTITSSGVYHGHFTKTGYHSYYTPPTSSMSVHRRTFRLRSGRAYDYNWHVEAS